MKVIGTPAGALPASSLDIPLPRKPKPASALEIACIHVAHAWGEMPDISWAVGHDQVTSITKVYKPGLGCDGEIPYIAVWQGEHLFAEYAQHMIVGLTFKVPANA